MALVALSNRIRPAAPKTFRYFAEQGVAVKVISGDNPVTVSEVARQAGIEGADKYVDAATLRSDRTSPAPCGSTPCSAGSPPTRSASWCAPSSGQGHTVAMTGDGVNDVLALKDADCGIAMASGSDAACHAAQLVLLNSDFSAMPKVVAEGRRVINNIQRAAALYLVKNIFFLPAGPHLPVRHLPLSGHPAAALPAQRRHHRRALLLPGPGAQPQHRQG